MKRRSNIVPSLTVALLAAVALLGPCSAGPVFNFQYSFPNGYYNASASGTLTTGDFDPLTSTYQITGITGTRMYNGTSMNITGIIAEPPLPNSNRLHLDGGPVLDLNGIWFTVDNTALSNNGYGDVSVYYSPFYDVYLEDAAGTGTGLFQVTEVVAQQTPEPSTFALIALGSAGVLVWSRKRRQFRR